MDFTTSGDYRVFLVFYTMGLGGVQTKMLGLANAIVSRGHACWVLLDEKGDHNRIDRFDPRVRVFVCWDHPRLAAWPFRRLRGLRFIMFVIVMMVVFRPARVFLSLCTLAVPIVSFFQRFNPSVLDKIVINEDTYPSLELSYEHPLWGKTKLSRVYSRVKRVVAVSKSTYANLHNAFDIPSPPLVYIPNWATGNSDNSVLSKPRTIDILYGGRIDPQKQPHLLLKTIELLLADSPDLVIRLYGDGLLTNAVDRHIKHLQRNYNIQRANPIGDFTAVLQNAKILLFTSLYEGLPFVALEAMVEGAVVAGLDVPGVRDVVTDGKTGILATSTEQLARKIVTVLNDNRKRKKMAAAALLRVQREFSVKNRDALTNLILE